MSVKRLYTTKSKINKEFIQKLVTNFKSATGTITKIHEVVETGEMFDITSFETMDTSLGLKTIVHIKYEDRNFKCWATSDIMKLTTEDQFKKLWDEPTFKAYVMKYNGKIGQKFIFDLITVKTTKDH